MSIILIIILWIIFCIAIFYVTRRKKEIKDEPKNISTQSNQDVLLGMRDILEELAKEAGYNTENSNYSNKSHRLSNYQDYIVHSLIIKSLESIYILENSKNIDTIVGRYGFLKDNINELIDLSKDSRYNIDMQIGLDYYKKSYYDKIPTQAQLLAISNPEKANIELFYKMALTRSIVEYYHDHSKAIKGLQRQNAIDKRKASIIQMCHYVKKHLDECINKSGLDEVYNLVDRIIDLVNNNNFDEEFNLEFKITGL